MGVSIALVHGAWLGSWCWDKVIPHLQKNNARIAVPELPGHGKDQTPVKGISLDSYVETVAECIPEQGPPVVLVGHSMAGAVISTVAEKMPDRVAALIYLAAYLMTNGESITEVSQTVKDSRVPQNMEFAADYSTVAMRKTGLKEVLCADAEDGDVALIEKLARPEPVAPFNSQLCLSDAKYGRVARAYIRTSNDRAVTPTLQEQMLKALPCPQVRTMNTSHAPFFSAPEELARHILEISQAPAKAHA